MMKLAVFLALAAVAAARPQQYGPPSPAAPANGGYEQPAQQGGGYQQSQSNGYQGNLVGAAQTLQQSEAGMPYQFQWEVKDAASGNDYSHQQSSDGTLTQGEYRVVLPDSRVQIVKFTADAEKGYVAEVTYEGEAVYPQASNQVPVVAQYNQPAPSQQQQYSQSAPSQQQQYSQPAPAAPQPQYSQPAPAQQQQYSQPAPAAPQPQYSRPAPRPSASYGAPSRR